MEKLNETIGPLADQTLPPIAPRVIPPVQAAAFGLPGIPALVTFTSRYNRMLSLAAYAGTYAERHYPGPLHRDISGTGDGANQCQQRHTTNKFSNYVCHLEFLCRCVHFFVLKSGVE